MCKNGKNAQNRKFCIFGNKKKTAVANHYDLILWGVLLTQHQSEKSHGTSSFGLQQIMAISSRT